MSLGDSKSQDQLKAQSPGGFNCSEQVLLDGMPDKLQCLPPLPSPQLGDGLMSRPL